jgi:hypothetical protein
MMWDKTTTYGWQFKTSPLTVEESHLRWLSTRDDNISNKVALLNRRLAYPTSSSISSKEIWALDLPMFTLLYKKALRLSRSESRVSFVK